MSAASARRVARLSSSIVCSLPRSSAATRILRPTASLSPLVTSARSSHFLGLSAKVVVGRRYASSAAALKEADAEAGEPEWPERILPEITAKDVKRLSRQRNIGM